MRPNSFTITSEVVESGFTVTTEIVAESAPCYCGGTTHLRLNDYLTVLRIQDALLPIVFADTVFVNKAMRSQLVCLSDNGFAYITVTVDTTSDSKPQAGNQTPSNMASSYILHFYKADLDPNYFGSDFNSTKVDTKTATPPTMHPFDYTPSLWTRIRNAISTLTGV